MNLNSPKEASPFRLVLAATYVFALVVVCLDLFVWRTT